MRGLEKNTSEIWVNNLALDKIDVQKPNSEKLMQHYSKLPEIFTRF